MSKILIFGHKNPDTDSICSALVAKHLYQALGEEVEARRLGTMNKETKYVLDTLKIAEPELLEKIEEEQEVILVDHNEFSQSVAGIEEAKIVRVVDHHRISGFQTSEPLYYRAEPVGCTATVLYQLYQENNVTIEKKEAALMLSAIISDTLLFKSPTCTKKDQIVAQELAKIAEIDVESYGLEMLKAGTNLSDLTAEELIHVDAKEVMLNDVKSVIAQVNTVDILEMMKRKEELEQEMQKEIKEKNLDIFLLAITDILESNSQVIALGKRADLVEKSYQVTLENNTAFLKGVVSRKKQIIPIISKNV